MQTSTAGRKFIEGFEGCILHAYQDSGGVWTIGYGHTSEAGPPHVSSGQTWSAQQADEVLSADLHAVETQISTAVKVPLLQNQFDAIVSFCFNCGRVANVAQYLNAHNFEGAANYMGAFLHDRHGNLLTGLQRRRTAERAMFLNIPMEG